MLVSHILAVLVVLILVNISSQKMHFFVSYGGVPLLPQFDVLTVLCVTQSISSWFTAMFIFFATHMRKLKKPKDRSKDIAHDNIEIMLEILGRLDNIEHRMDNIEQRMEKFESIVEQRLSIVEAKIEMTSIPVVKAKQLCKKTESEPLKLGDKWCLISHKWWMNFVESAESANSSSSLKLPPISNANLTEKISDGNYELKPKMVETFDFNLVPETVFNSLMDAFGVECWPRDIIKREVVEGTLINKASFVEIYPLEIKIARLSNKSQVVTLKISLSETIDGIRDKAMEALEIPESSRHVAQFFVEENGKYEPLSGMAKFKLQSLLASDNMIFIDEAGTGPSMVEPKLEDFNGSRRYGYNSNISIPREPQQLGLCGLQNLGNTCFMNSALQCLSNVPELTEYFLRGHYDAEINFDNPLGTQGRLVRAYAEMIQEMWAGTTLTVRPNKLKSVIGQFAPRFNGSDQQDSQELTSFLLDGLHEELNRIKVKPSSIEAKECVGKPDAVVAEEIWLNYKKRDDSIIVDLFYGQLKSTLVCPVCEIVSVKFDAFCSLPVPVPAKERLVKSEIVHVRSKKWAKFLITHTSKTSVGKALEEIKNNLQIDPSTRLVLVSNQGEIFREESVLPSMQCSIYTTKTYYAYAVNSGSVITIENKLMSPIDRPLSVPLAINLSTLKISRQFILDCVLPVVKELFWRSTSNEIDDGISVDENSPEKSNDTVILPTEIIIYCDGMVLNVAANSTEEIDLREYDLSTMKIVLKWDTSARFQQFNPDTIVDRKLNLATSIKESYTLNECVDFFTNKEQLSEDDSWYCPTCKKHERAFKKLDLWFLPQILIVHLKRFQHTGFYRKKINTRIIVPVKGLDLTDKLPDLSNRKSKYDLIAVNNHSGELGSGHYTAKALNNGHWCEFNDSSAYVSTDLKEPFGTHEGYILYYRRRPADTSSDKSKRFPSSSASSQTEVYTAKNGNSPSPSNSSASKRRIGESKIMID